MATKTDDFTKAAQAKTKEDVDAQDTRTKLYQSLGYTYGQQMDESDKAYDKEISQQANAALARGMGRSSYALQTQANLQNQKAEARNKLGQALIADYQNRVTQIDEAEAAREFQKSEREAQQAWQSSENALARAFQTSEREAQQAYSTGEREAQQAYSTSEREASQKYSTAERFAQQEWQAGQSALERAQNQAQFEAQLAYQREQLAQNQSQFEIQQAFQEKQWAAQQDQWKQEFNYTQMSDSQKIAYNYIVAAAAQGGDVSDALLKQAGISREDYNAMKTKATSITAGTTKKTPEEPTTPAPTDSDLEKAVAAITSANSTVTGSVVTAAQGVTAGPYVKPTTKTTTGGKAPNNKVTMVK